jgi:hypothetical protein
MVSLEDRFDKYDLLMGAVAGIFSGLLDVFFVGTPGDSILGSWTDAKTNSIVMKFAQFKGFDNIKDDGKDMQRAIQYLEGLYPVNYDQDKSQNVGNVVRHLSASNHHVKSLGHCPDLIGLAVSIMDQFQGKSTFIDDCSGKIIRINSGFELEGSNFISKVYAGAGNWFGHLMSDIAGSNGSAGRGNRGRGIPIPFYEMFEFCNFGEFGQYKQPLSTIMVQVFEKGYDLRFGVAMAIPPIIGDLLTMLSWSIKRRFYHEWDWRNCIPSDKYKSYRRIQLVNKGAFCLVDGADAAIRGHGDPIEIILRMNLIAWFQLVKLIIKELMITYGRSYEDLVKDLMVVDKALDEELVKLKSYDYVAWQEENEKVEELNKRLNLNDKLQIGNLATEYVFSSESELKYHNFDEFDQIFSKNGKLF